MAVTVTPVADKVTADRRHSFGDLYGVISTILFDNSYPTGGEVVTPQQFGLDDHIEAMVPLLTGGARILEFDKANLKVKLFTALGTEAADTSDQSSITATVLVLGK